MTIGDSATSREVVAFACSLCAKVFATREPADACCQCVVCHVKLTAADVNKSNAHAHCRHERDMRAARSSVARAEERLRREREWLEQVSAEAQTTRPAHS